MAQASSAKVHFDVSRWISVAESESAFAMSASSCRVSVGVFEMQVGRRLGEAEWVSRKGTCVEDGKAIRPGPGPGRGSRAPGACQPSGTTTG